MSIKLKINLLLLVLGIVAALATATYNYNFQKKQVFANALAEAEIINSFGMSAKKYTSQVMNPLAMEAFDGYITEIMSGFYVARAIADMFAEAKPGYSFKQADDNPTNPDNRANAMEEDVIRYFQANPEVKIKKGITQKAGEEYFYVAKPIVAEEKCMKCHGKKEGTFPPRAARYPGNGGYDYKLGEVEATYINYVPIKEALNRARSSAIRTAFAGIISILVIIIAVWFFLQNFITKPIIRLTETADAMSHGKGIESELKAPSKDEIGDLYWAFNRMRVSIVKMREMILRKRK